MPTNLDRRHRSPLCTLPPARTLFPFCLPIADSARLVAETGCLARDLPGIRTLRGIRRSAAVPLSAAPRPGGRPAASRVDARPRVPGRARVQAGAGPAAAEHGVDAPAPLKPPEFRAWEGTWVHTSSRFKDNIYLILEVEAPGPAGFAYSTEYRDVPYGLSMMTDGPRQAAFASPLTAADVLTGERFRLRVDPVPAASRAATGSRPGIRSCATDARRQRPVRWRQPWCPALHRRSRHGRSGARASALPSAEVGRRHRWWRAGRAWRRPSAWPICLRNGS